MNEAERTLDYVGFWRRALASTIDNVTWLIGGSMLVGYLPSSVWDDHPEVVVLLLFVLASAWFNYFALSEWRWGQTIGKNTTGIEVRSIDGAERLTFGQASIRNLLRLVDFFLVGELMIISTKRKQRLGDKLAKTVVVRRAPSIKRVAPVSNGWLREEPPRTTPSHKAPIRGAAEPVAAESAIGKEADGKEPPPAKFRLPPVPWTPKDTLWGLIGGLLLAIIVPPLLVVPFDPNLDSDGALLAAQGIFDGLLVTVAIGMASGWRFRPFGRALELLGLRPFRLTAIGIMIATLVAYYIAAGLFASLVLKPDQEDIGGDLGVGNPSLLIAVTAVVMIVAVAPVTEELFFRGFIFAGLRSRWSLWPAAIVSGLIFGLVHATTGITAVVPLAALGFALCWLYDRTGSLWLCVIAHAINNGLALAVVT
jgi:membrane protease YdiL (CAAX protease family)/uncharacterized RDD family membrane protein YckC